MGSSEGKKKPDAVANVKARKAVPATGRPTCPRLPAPKACNGWTLNPETGPAQTGKRPEFAPP